MINRKIRSRIKDEARLELMYVLIAFIQVIFRPSQE